MNAPHHHHKREESGTQFIKKVANLASVSPTFRKILVVIGLLAFPSLRDVAHVKGDAVTPQDVAQIQSELKRQDRAIEELTRRFDDYMGNRAMSKTAYAPLDTKGVRTLP